jgi:hypothetical protein
MFRILLCTSLLLALNALGATTRPATTQSVEEQLAQHKRDEQRDYLAQIQGTPEIKLPTGKISDIFDLTIDNGQLSVRPRLSPTDGPSRCTVQGLAGPSTIAIFTEQNVPDGGITALQFAHRDFSNPDQVFRHTMLFAHARSVQLSMDLDSLSQSKSASLIQDLNPEDPDNAVRLNAQLIDALTDDIIGQYNFAATNFATLRIEHPRETQEFVVPILRDLQSESILAPDSRVAAQVLGIEARADDVLTKKIDAALAKFDSDNFQDREDAAKDLEQLGQRAAAALRHADRKGWSIDRQSGVDAFLAKHKSMGDSDAATLKREPIFLLDCLFSDDPAIERASADALEKMSHLKIDPMATGASRDAQIDQVYSALFPPLATRPTTRP